MSIHTPPIPSLPPWQVRRPRLVEALGDAASRVVALVAGSGFGKTALLAEYADARNSAERIVAVRIDDSIESPADFWHHFALSALVDDMDGRELDWNEGHRVARSSRVPVTVAIDCSDRELPAGVIDDLARLLRLVPTLRVIVASRSGGLVELLDPDRRLTARTLDEEALRFTHQEIREASLLHGLALSDSRMTALEEDTAGWPFGVDAILGSQASTGSIARSSQQVDRLILRRIRSSAGSHPHPVDILTICMTGRSDSSMMVALGLRPSDWRSASDMLARGGLGWWVEETDPVFHVAPMVQKAAQRELRSSFADSFRTAQSRLSDHLVAQGAPGPAFRAALDAEEWKRAESILKRHYIDIVSSESRQGPVLADRRFSARRHPFLVLFAGVEQYSRGKHITAARLIGTAIAVCEAQRMTDHGRPSADRVWIQGVLLIGLRLAGVYQFVPRALDRFLDILRRADDPDGDLAAIDPVIGTQTATTFLYLGDPAAARSMLAASVHWADVGETTRQTLHWLSVRAFAEVMDGYDAAALATLAEIDSVPLAAQTRRNFYAVLAHAAAAVLAVERHELPLAESELELTMDHWPTMEHWPLVAHTRVKLAWKKDGPGAALALLDEVIAEKRERAGISPYLRAELRALRTDLLLADFRTDEARTILEQERGSMFVAVEVVRIRHLILAGRPHDALAAARLLLRRAGLGRRHRPELLLLAASAAHRVHDETTARNFFDDALALARPSGRTDPFAMTIRADFLALCPPGDPIRDAVAAQPAYFSVREPTVALTRREHIVLERLPAGLTLAEIAAELNVSVNTVRNQTASIYRKLGVTRREEAVDRARKAHLL